MATLRFALVALMASVAAAGPVQNTPTRYSKNMNTLAEKKQIAEKSCRQASCRMSCLYKSFGVVDDSGRYIESAAADFLAIRIPEDHRDYAAAKQAAQTCSNSVNDQIVEDCNRTLQIDECIVTEYDKIINRADTTTDVKLICTKANDECHRACVFHTFGLMDDLGQLDAEAAIDLLTVTYPEFNINKLGSIAKTCGGLAGKNLDNCESADTLWKCFEEQYAKENREAEMNVVK